jgi:hypothetical protein
MLQHGGQQFPVKLAILYDQYFGPAFFISHVKIGSNFPD